MIRASLKSSLLFGALIIPSIVFGNSDTMPGNEGLKSGVSDQVKYEYRFVPHFFASQGFEGNKVKLNSKSIQNALKSLECQRNLLENTLSPRSALGSEEVKRLQKFLKERVGADVLITGNYRSQTTLAVQLLQAEHFKTGLYARGIVDERTKKLINLLECQALFGEYLNQAN